MIEITEKEEVEDIEELPEEEDIDETSEDEEQSKNVEEKTKGEVENKKKQIKKLKKKYGVTKDIPKQKVEEYEEDDEIKEEKPKGLEVSMENLLLKTEKLDTKLDIIDRFRGDTNERIIVLAEEIGELRSMIMETDRSFSQIETNFETMKDTVGDVEPLKIRKEFEKREQELTETKVKLEKLENMIKALEQEAKSFRETMEKIKSFENLVEVSKKIDKKISKIEDTKKYADKTAAKVESIFGEMSERLSDIEKERAKITKLDELTIEMAKMLDEVSSRLDKFQEKKDLKDFKKGIEDDMKTIKMSIQTKTKSGEVKYIPGVGEEFKKITEDFSELSSRVTGLKSIMEKQPKSKGIDVGSLKQMNLNNRFFQVSNILLHTTNPIRLKTYSEEMKEIVKKMKNMNLWDEEKELFMKDILTTTRKIGELKGQKEALTRMDELATWVTNVLEEIKIIKETRRALQKDLEEVKKSVRSKVDVKEVENVLILEKQLSELSSKISKLKSVMERQSLVIDDVVGVLHERESAGIEPELLRNMELVTKFYQLLHMLPYVKETSELNKHSIELKEVIEEMKLDGIWDNEKEKFMRSVLEMSKKFGKTEEKKERILNEISVKMDRFTKKKELREFEKNIKKDLDYLKESLKKKVSTEEIEPVFNLERKISELSSKSSRLKSVLEKQNSIITNIVENIREKESIGVDAKSIRKVQLSVRFYQLLNMLPYVIEPSRIKKYMVELKEVVEEMKLDGTWDNEKEMFMKNFLSSLSDNYKSRGYEEIGMAYAHGL